MADGGIRTPVLNAAFWLTNLPATVAGRDKRLTNATSKSPGAIKVLDAAAQDDVAMRNILWRGTRFYERKLSELHRVMASLVVQRRKLQVSQKHFAQGNQNRRRNPMARTVGKMEFRDVKSEIKSV
jgi:hypothetical protein